MTEKVITCTGQSAHQRPDGDDDDGKFRHVPVVEERHASSGIVSIGDIVKHRLAEIEAETPGDAGLYRDRLRARDSPASDGQGAGCLRVADHLHDVGQGPFGGLAAELDAFLGAVELEQAHLGELRARS